MKPNNAILATYAVSLAVLSLSAREILSDISIARIAILLSILSGAYAALPKNKDSKFKDLKTKIDSRESLVAILIVSTTIATPYFLGRLLSSYPGTLFSFDFIFLFPIIALATPYYLALQWKITGERSFCNRIIEVTKKREKIPKKDAVQFLLMWTVKIIFIPLMYFWSTTTTTALLNFNWTFSPEKIASGLFIIGLSIDLLIGISGYLLSSKIFKSEIISTDTYWLGWLSCLICYPPLLYFLQLASAQTDSTTWNNYFDASQPMYWVWATILSCSWIAYWASTLNFGIRFSNLSWRGLVDTGLYKYTKHPAYISKNLYWWMYTIPFIGAETWLETTRNILGMTTLSLIYLLRAKTEERHLLQFEEYQEYSRKIEAQGIISKIKGKTKSALKTLK